MNQPNPAQPPIDAAMREQDLEIGECIAQFIENGEARRLDRDDAACIRRLIAAREPTAAQGVGKGFDAWWNSFTISTDEPDTMNDRTFAKAAWDAAISQPIEPQGAVVGEAARVESALRRLADECDNDRVPGWEDRMQACIAESNAVLSRDTALPAPSGFPRSWKNSVRVAIETLQTESEHRREGGHEASASEMKRAITDLKRMVYTIPPVAQGAALPVAVGAGEDSNG